MEMTPEVRAEIIRSNNIANIMTNLALYDDGALDLTPEEAASLFDRQRNLVDSSFDEKEELEDEEKRLRKKAQLFTEAARVVKNDLNRLKNFMTYALTKSGSKEAFGHDFRVILKTSHLVREFEPPTPEQALKFPDCIEIKTKWKNAEPTEEQKRILQIKGIDRDFIETVYEWKKVEATAVLEKNPAAFDGRFGYLITTHPEWKVNKNVSTKRKSSSRSTSKNSGNATRAIGEANPSGPTGHRINDGAPIADCVDGDSSHAAISEV